MTPEYEWSLLVRVLVFTPDHRVVAAVNALEVSRYGKAALAEIGSDAVLLAAQGAQWTTLRDKFIQCWKRHAEVEGCA